MKAGTLLAAAGALVIASAASAQVFNFSPSAVIPPSGTGGSGTSTTVVPLEVTGGPSSITDLNVTISLTHTWNSDLDITLISPDGQSYVKLSTDNGGSGDNYLDTKFDEQAEVAITAGASPFTGTFRPEATPFDTADTWASTVLTLPPNSVNFSAFNGTDANGTWTLVIHDDAGGDTGLLSSVSLEFNGAIPATPPRISSSSATAIGCVVAGSGGQVQLLATVTPGGNPVSTGITVSVDANGIGAGTVALLDDGLSGDGAAGDNVFGGVVTISAAQPAGTTPALPATALDAQGRSSITNIAGVAVRLNPTPTGSLPATAQTLAGNPGDPVTQITGNLTPTEPQMWRIQICSPTTFSATTFPGTTWDTQLFLFDEQGVGVVFNDDGPTGQGLRSTIDSTVPSALPAGVYYLALSRYNVDPVVTDDACATLASNLIWLNSPFVGQRVPNGPAAASPVLGWLSDTLTVPSAGAFTIDLQGVCVPGTGSACDSVDFNNDGVFPDDADLADFILVLGGGVCPTCNDVDFNNDGVFPDDSDLQTLLIVLGGGTC